MRIAPLDSDSVLAKYDMYMRHESLIIIVCISHVQISLLCETYVISLSYGTYVISLSCKTYVMYFFVLIPEYTGKIR